MQAKRHRHFAWAGAVLALVALIVDGAAIIPVRMAEGGGFLRALVFFLSYFGQLVVLGQGLLWLAVASEAEALRWLRGPTARTALAAAAVGVILGYPVLFASGIAPAAKGFGTLLTHGFVPLAFLLWWAVGPHPVALRWARVWPMLAFPALYAVWVVVRGVWIGRWPYPFTSVPDLGWGQALINLILFVVAFGLLFVVFIALERFLHDRSASVPRRRGSGRF